MLYQARTRNNYTDNKSKEVLEHFLYELVDEIDMQVLIPAQLEFSHQKAWTGIVGIITSHISFHYWTIEKCVQMDIYSCKEFDKNKATNFMSEFWDAYDIRTLFIDRETGKGYKIESNP